MSNEPIRILHVLTAMNRAGAETMLMNLYRDFDRTKIQFDFAVTTTKHCDYDDEIESLGGHIIHYPLYTGKNHFAYKKWWREFFCNHPEYRIVHGHIGSTAAIYLKIAKKYGCFTIAHSHSTSGGFGLRKLLYKIYSFPTRYIADFCVGCSTEALVSRYGRKMAKLDKSRILPNGVDVDKYRYDPIINAEVRKELGISEGQIVVGTVGRLYQPKNPYFIIDILIELKKYCRDYVFLWVGTGELKDEIFALIKDNNLQDNVLLLGVRSDVPRILQALNVFILPSIYEGLPVIGVEVQSAGIPMLCSDKVSPEVGLSKCCKFLPITSVKPWVDGILKEQEFRRILDASNDVINAGFDIHTTAEWLMDFYTKNWKNN